MKNILMLFALILGSTPLFSQNGRSSDSTTTIQIDPDKIRSRLEGIGASWHAISQEKIDEDKEYKWALRYKNSRGSSWGGNPPVSDIQAWNQIYKYAEWLGLNWITVEISARMYEPQKDIFDWNNDEMKALYNILDWAERNGADVFLRQMWSNVKWNAYPGVQPLLSAPRSITDFSDGLATLAEHLIKGKKYTCIKWLCISNEPPAWWSKGPEAAPLTPALKAVREALDKKGIPLQISSPDWTELPQFDSNQIDFDQYIGAYDIHCYGRIDSSRQKNLADWTEWAREHHKPLFLSEMGDMALGWHDENPGPKSFKEALSNAETILKGMEVGVNGFSRWSFTNRGDLDGQWQLIHTWDRANKKYLKQVEIEPAAFYGFGIITRFCVKNSAVVQTKVNGDVGILSQTIKSPQGKLTIYVLNLADKPKNIDLKIMGKVNHLYLYTAIEAEISNPAYKMRAKKIIIPGSGVFNFEIPPQSIYTLSEFNLKPEGPGKIDD